MGTEHTASKEEVIQVESTVPRDADVEATSQIGKEIEQAQDKREGRKEGIALQDREPGKSILPFSRVQKIMKADKDLPMVARDATILISLATEEFIKRLSQACQRLAEREKRATVQQRDVGKVSLFCVVCCSSQHLVANIVRRVDEFLFLEGVDGKRKPQKARVDAGAPGDQDQLQPTLRNFMWRDNENEDTRVTNDVVMNEDGAMYVG
ncbi:hypothetical protein J3R83DRAFT_13123 [Lanmaoa asiatica]|nr:hypothetical protein J3R83DRAFT_13123 [Lanmaoa asiatica]